jgi:nucleoside phosphorylase
MGREQAQALASNLMHAQPAKCIAMSGICAGRRGKVELGDVIFADRLWSYDSGKINTEDGKTVFQGDMLQYRPPQMWIQRMQALPVLPGPAWLNKRPTLPLENQEDWVIVQLYNQKDPRKNDALMTHCPNWSEVVQRLWKRKWVEKPLALTASGRERAEMLEILCSGNMTPPSDFRVHVGPMATGAAVTEDEGIFPRLSNSMRKVIGIDMEASALGALAEFHGIPVLIAKGVSDYGDPFKDDRYRHFAARAAAECLISLIRNGADLLGVGVKTANYIPVAVDQQRSTTIPDDLILTLAESFPDIRDARSLWERAGGRGSELESNPRPRDMWQRIWMRSTQGASVRPIDLLQAALQESPSNALLSRYVDLYRAR